MFLLFIPIGILVDLSEKIDKLKEFDVPLSEIINYYLAFQLFSILLMFFFQAEEVSTLLGVSIGLIILESNKNE